MKFERSTEQVHGGTRVVAFECTPAGLCQPLAGATRELDFPITHRPHLGPVAVGLLEVVADNLIEGIALLFEPVTDLDMKTCALDLGDAGVRDVADEDVVEAEELLLSRAGACGLDESPSNELEELPGENRRF
jgi:hypothetical protein